MCISRLLKVPPHMVHTVGCECSVRGKTCKPLMRCGIAAQNAGSNSTRRDGFWIQLCISLLQYSVIMSLQHVPPTTVVELLCTRNRAGLHVN